MKKYSLEATSGQGSTDKERGQNLKGNGKKKFDIATLGRVHVINEGTMAEKRKKRKNVQKIVRERAMMKVQS